MSKAESNQNLFVIFAVNQQETTKYVMPPKKILATSDKVHVSDLHLVRLQPSC